MSRIRRAYDTALWNNVRTPRTRIIQYSRLCNKCVGYTYEGSRNELMIRYGIREEEGTANK